MRVAATHFASTLKKQNQPYCLTLHLEFPRRTEVGPAKFIVRDVKLGRQISSIHISLHQHGQEEVLGYLTHTNLNNEQGVSFPTGWKLEPLPSPMINSKQLSQGGDDYWVEQKEMPFPEFRRASNQVRFFFPKKGQPMKSINDQWIC